MSDKTRPIILGGQTVNVPFHMSMNIYTSSRAEFVGTLEELAAVPGVTFKAMSYGSSAWVEVTAADGTDVDVFAPSNMLTKPDVAVAEANADLVRSVLAEVQS